MIWFIIKFRQITKIIIKYVNLTIIFFLFHHIREILIFFLLFTYTSFTFSSKSSSIQIHRTNDNQKKKKKHKKRTFYRPYKNQIYKSRLNSQQFTCAITPSGLSANRARSRVMQIKMEGKGQGCKGRSGREGCTNAMAHEGHHNGP